jgi:hypothetical protein
MKAKNTDFNGILNYNESVVIDYGVYDNSNVSRVLSVRNDSFGVELVEEWHNTEHNHHFKESIRISEDDFKRIGKAMGWL